MPQTTAAFSAKNAKIEYSTQTNTGWVDISGWANSITVSGGERQTGEAYTFDGDTAIVTTGKRAGRTAEITTLYTEGTTDAWVTLDTLYKAGTATYLRFTPRGLQGSLTGELVHTSSTSYSYITNVSLPEASSDSGDALTFTASWITSEFTTSTSST